MKTFAQGMTTGRARSGFASSTRRGSALLTVLVVTVLVTYFAWGYCNHMLTKARVTQTHVQRTRCRLAVDSGSAWLKAKLSIWGHDRAADFSLADSPQHTFDGVVVLEPDEYIAFLTPTSITGRSPVVEFGIENESSKLNVNALPVIDERQPGTAQQMLLALPGMTESTADAILDWIDSDQQPRSFGAESAWYTARNRRRPTNLPLRTLDELLSVHGVTSRLLYGTDDAADRLHVPWMHLLTVRSAESNLQPDGRPKIHLNRHSLTGLYDELKREFGGRTARYVVAWRMNGPFPDDSLTDENISDPQTEADAALARALRQRGDESEYKPRMIPPDERFRGGLDLVTGPAFRINSLIDLFGRSVAVLVDGNETMLDSPWSGDPSTLFSVLPQLSASLSTECVPLRRDRINIQSARRELLAGIPGITPALAAEIVRHRFDNASLLRQPPIRQCSIAWLLYDGLVDLKRLRRIAPYITVGGDVYRTRIVGYTDRKGPAAAGEVTIDASGDVPAIVAHKQLGDEIAQRAVRWIQAN